jgi:hypothetical protein
MISWWQLKHAADLRLSQILMCTRSLQVNVKTYQDFNGGRWLKHEASQVHVRMMVLPKFALKEGRDVPHVQVLACPDLWLVNQQSRLPKSSAYEAAALVGCGTFRPCANPNRSR